MSIEAPRPARTLIVRGARTHNLRSLDLELPLGSLVVVTGPSGSGKSSLAFATVHAESVRRFATASRSADADALALASMPDVDRIDGLPATLGLSQRGVVRHPKSTVATLSGVAATVRRLFARFGRPACPSCGGATESFDVGAVVARLASMPEGARITVLAAVAEGDVGDARATLATLSRAGFVRARIDGRIVALAEVGALPTRAPRRIEAVVDRLVVRPDELDRLREAIELAYRTGRGEAVVIDADEREMRFGRTPRCVACGTLAEPVPADAFLADPGGAVCPACAGTGLVARPEKPARRRGRAPAVPEDDERAADPETPCPTCSGLGLARNALAAQVEGQAYAALMTRPVADVAAFARAVLGAEGTPRALTAPLAVLASVGEFLVDVGLGHLQLARRAPTLSTGELARVRLAGLLANELVGIVYVLDEPTAGLHPSERPAIVRAMRRLVARGNTVLCVEHDAEVIAACDHVVELGTGAGPEGGRLLASCDVASLPDASLTRALLRGELALERHARPRERAAIEIASLDLGPLRGLDVAIPRGALTFVTGVSGSGKTTLLEALASVHRVLVDGGTFAHAQRVTGFDGIARAVRLDDVATVAGPRALVATRLGTFGPLRELFAGLPESRMRGYDAGRFALHAPGGRCEACAGTGRAPTDPGAPSVDAPCDRCEGRRYDEGTLAIRYRGLTIADVLDGTIDESLARFESIPALHEPLSHARRLGLGYVTLGRTLRGLSGGELVRLRLAAELAGSKPARTLYLLDEPSRGLHAVDLRRLVTALDELVDAGATVVVADHALEAIAVADHVLDLDVDAATRTTIQRDAGPPADVAHRALGPTGRCLASQVTRLRERY